MKQIIIVGMVLLLVMGAVSADKDKDTVRLEDLGLLQLAAHDFFNVDRSIPFDFENGKLDLSTLLDHGDENIALGGEPRNRENIILFTVASEYGYKYNHYLEFGYSEEEAKEKVIKRYHQELRVAYERVFGEEFPEAEDYEINATHNLALRTIHDFLPGTIVMDKEEVPTLDFSLHGKTLNKRELMQQSSKLDGQFDAAFLNITIFIPPDQIFTISLLERDSSFATQFSTDFGFEHFLAELEDGSYDPNDTVMQYIRELFAQGVVLG